MAAAGLAALGAGSGLGEAAGEAIETTGEVAQKLLDILTRQGRVPIAAATADIPTVAPTPEGTRQLRLILRARTREAKIAARAQILSTLSANPVAVLVLAFGSFSAAMAALRYLEIVGDSNVKTWAKAVRESQPSLKMDGLPTLPDALTSTPSAAIPFGLGPLSAAAELAKGGMLRGL